MTLADTKLGLPSEVWSVLHALEAYEEEWTRPDGEYGLTVLTTPYNGANIQGFALRAWIGSQASGDYQTVLVGKGSDPDDPLVVVDWGIRKGSAEDGAPSLKDCPDKPRIDRSIGPTDRPESVVYDAVSSVRGILNRFYVLTHPREMTIFDHIEETED